MHIKNYVMNNDSQIMCEDAIKIKSITKDHIRKKILKLLFK